MNGKKLAYIGGLYRLAFVHVSEKDMVVGSMIKKQDCRTTKE